MKIGIFFLVLGYVLSQFYRVFLAVLAPILKADLGVSPEQLSTASGLWFLTFAAMQLPVGAALDRIGPKYTASVLLAVGGAGGAVLFALAQSAFQVTLAMGMIGIGCSPVLMSSYYIFAKHYSPAVFATMAGAVLGVGTFGNVASSLPLTWAVELFGWRETLLAVAAATFVVSILIFLLIPANGPEAKADVQRGSVLDLLKIPMLWPIMAMMLVNYAAAAGIRALWIGPYLSDVFHLTAESVGIGTLVMGAAMIVGNFVYGPLDRLIASRKTIVFAGNLLGALCCLLLYVVADYNVVLSVALLAGVGLFGASFVVIIAHARDFIPAHLTGRGVTLLNLFGIGGAGIMQTASGRLYAGVSGGAATAAEPYQALFLFFGVTLLAGLLVYFFSKETR